MCFPGDAFIPAAAQGPQPWTQVGSLMCKVNPSIGFIIVGHQPMGVYLYADARTGTAAILRRRHRHVGLDFGVSAGSVLGWGVFAPTNGVSPGALAGEYVGVTGDVGFGIGGGANVLVAAPPARSRCNRCPCRARSL